MRLKAVGIMFTLGLMAFLLGTGAQAKTYEDDVVEVKAMIINEPPITVKAVEAKEEPTVIEEPEYKLLDIRLTEDEQIFMQTMCESAGVDYEFALALMKSESDFKWLVGDKNLKHPAIGYFQISTINEERMDSQYSLDIYDRLDNIEAGIRIIAELQETFKDGYKGYFDTETCIVMCYKCGIGRGKELMSDGIVLGIVDTIKADKEAFK